jgi:hypothetical protein
MAGQKDLSGVQANQMAAPYGVGFGFVPEDSNAWESDLDGPNAWQTFREDLDPDEPYG